MFQFSQNLVRQFRAQLAAANLPANHPISGGFNALVLFIEMMHCENNKEICDALIAAFAKLQLVTDVKWNATEKALAESFIQIFSNHEKSFISVGQMQLTHAATQLTLNFEQLSHLFSLQPHFTPAFLSQLMLHIDVAGTKSNITAALEQAELPNIISMEALPKEFTQLGDFIFRLASSEKELTEFITKFLDAKLSKEQSFLLFAYVFSRPIEPSREKEAKKTYALLFKSLIGHFNGVQIPPEQWTNLVHANNFKVICENLPRRGTSKFGYIEIFLNSFYPPTEKHPEIFNKIENRRCLLEFTEIMAALDYDRFFHYFEKLPKEFHPAHTLKSNAAFCELIKKLRDHYSPYSDTIIIVIDNACRMHCNQNYLDIDERLFHMDSEFLDILFKALQRLTSLTLRQILAIRHLINISTYDAQHTMQLHCDAIYSLQSILGKIKITTQENIIETKKMLNLTLLEAKNEIKYNHSISSRRIIDKKISKFTSADISLFEQGKDYRHRTEEMLKYLINIDISFFDLELLEDYGQFYGDAIKILCSNDLLALSPGHSQYISYTSHTSFKIHDALKTEKFLRGMLRSEYECQPTLVGRYESSLESKILITEEKYISIISKIFSEIKNYHSPRPNTREYILEKIHDNDRFLFRLLSDNLFHSPKRIQKLLEEKKSALKILRDKKNEALCTLAISFFEKNTALQVAWESWRQEYNDYVEKFSYILNKMLQDLSSEKRPIIFQRMLRFLITQTACTFELPEENFDDLMKNIISVINTSNNPTEMAQDFIKVCAVAKSKNKEHLRWVLKIVEQIPKGAQMTFKDIVGSGSNLYDSFQLRFSFMGKILISRQIAKTLTTKDIDLFVAELNACVKILKAECQGFEQANLSIIFLQKNIITFLLNPGNIVHYYTIFEMFNSLGGLIFNTDHILMLAPLIKKLSLSAPSEYFAALLTLINYHGDLSNLNSCLNAPSLVALFSALASDADRQSLYEKFVKKDFINNEKLTKIFVDALQDDTSDKSLAFQFFSCIAKLDPEFLHNAAVIGSIENYIMHDQSGVFTEIALFRWRDTLRDLDSVALELVANQFSDRVNTYCAPNLTPIYNVLFALKAHPEAQRAVLHLLRYSLAALLKMNETHHTLRTACKQFYSALADDPRVKTYFFQFLINFELDYSKIKLPMNNSNNNAQNSFSAPQQSSAQGSFKNFVGNMGSFFSFKSNNTNASSPQQSFNNTNASVTYPQLTTKPGVERSYGDLNNLTSTTANQSQPQHSFGNINSTDTAAQASHQKPGFETHHRELNPQASMSASNSRAYGSLAQMGTFNSVNSNALSTANFENDFKVFKDSQKTRMLNRAMNRENKIRPGEISFKSTAINLLWSVFSDFGETDKKIPNVGPRTQYTKTAEYQQINQCIQKIDASQCFEKTSILEIILAFFPKDQKGSSTASTYALSYIQIAIELLSELYVNSRHEVVGLIDFKVSNNNNNSSYTSSSNSMMYNSNAQNTMGSQTYERK